MARCNICGNRWDRGHFCRACQMTLFQINEILENYLNGNVPEWMSDAIREFDFIYQRDLKKRAYFNVAVEIVDSMVIEKLSTVRIDDIDELNHTNIAQEKIISVLERAKIAERHNSELYIGELTKQLKDLRFSGHMLNTREIQKAILEIHGVLAVALTKAMLEMDVYKPRGAISILNMLSMQILVSKNEDGIDSKVPENIQQACFNNVPTRQEKHMKWHMSGFYDGRTRLIDDVDENWNLILKPQIVRYLTRMRDRVRERKRDVLR